MKNIKRKEPRHLCEFMCRLCSLFLQAPQDNESHGKWHTKANNNNNLKNKIKTIHLVFVWLQRKHSQSLKMYKMNNSKW
jgi:hypothetical protein